MRRVLVLNGPNLGVLGRREPELYGSATLAELEQRLTARGQELDIEVRCEQTNHEGRMVDLLGEEAGRADGCILNPAGLGHTSVVLLDAVRFFAAPVVEVHLSNVHAREHFRHRCLTAQAARGVVMGLGQEGYVLALEALARILDDNRDKEG